MPTERKEPTYSYTEKQVADKSEIARRFLETRTRLNANVDKADNYLVKRFYNIDGNDPLLYDLVINTARMSAEAACDLICTALQQERFR